MESENHAKTHSARLAAKKLKTYEDLAEESEERDKSEQFVLPAGWQVTERERYSGDRIDRVFKSPCGKSFRSVKSALAFLSGHGDSEEEEEEPPAAAAKKRPTNDPGKQTKRKRGSMGESLSRDPYDIERLGRGIALHGMKENLRVLKTFPPNMFSAKGAFMYLRKVALQNITLKVAVPALNRFPTLDDCTMAYGEAFMAIGMHRTTKDLIQKHYHIWRFPDDFDVQGFSSAFDSLVGTNPAEGGDDDEDSSDSGPEVAAPVVEKKYTPMPTGLPRGRKPKGKPKLKPERLGSASNSDAPLTGRASTSGRTTETVIPDAMADVPQPMNCTKLFARNGDWFKSLRCKSCISKKSEACRFLGIRVLRFQNISYGKLVQPMPVLWDWKSATAPIDDALVPVFGKRTLQPQTMSPYSLHWLQPLLIDQLNKEIGMGEPVCLRTRVAGVRHLCDVCGCTILYRYFLCMACSRETCLACSGLKHDSRRGSGVQCEGTSILVGYTTHENLTNALAFVQSKMGGVASVEEIRSQVDAAAELSKPQLGPAEFHTDVDLQNFRQVWAAFRPVVIQDFGRQLTQEWSSAGLVAALGDSDPIQMMNAADGSVVTHLTAATFFAGFHDETVRERSTADGEKMLLVLRDYPSPNNFSSLLPNHLSELLAKLPLSDYTHPNGTNNLLSCAVTDSGEEIPLGENGPRLVVSYGSACSPEGMTIRGPSTVLKRSQTDLCVLVTSTGSHTRIERDGTPKAFMGFCEHRGIRRASTSSRDPATLGINLNKEWRSLSKKEHEYYLQHTPSGIVAKSSVKIDEDSEEDYLENGIFDVECQKSGTGSRGRRRSRRQVPHHLHHKNQISDEENYDSRNRFHDLVSVASEYSATASSSNAYRFGGPQGFESFNSCQIPVFAAVAAAASATAAHMVSADPNGPSPFTQMLTNPSVVFQNPDFVSSLSAQLGHNFQMTWPFQQVFSEQIKMQQQQQQPSAEASHSTSPDLTSHFLRPDMDSSSYPSQLDGANDQSGQSNVTETSLTPAAPPTVEPTEPDAAASPVVVPAVPDAAVTDPPPIQNDLPPPQEVPFKMDEAVFPAQQEKILLPESSLSSSHDNSNVNNNMNTIDSFQHPPPLLLDPLVSRYPAAAILWHVFQPEDHRILKKFFFSLQHPQYQSLHGDGRDPVSEIGMYNTYLTPHLLQQLDSNHGIVPYTIVQMEGDLVMIPAGCPFQAFDLRANIRVELDFLSPEHLSPETHAAVSLGSHDARHRRPSIFQSQDALELKMLLHGALLHALAAEREKA